MPDWKEHLKTGLVVEGLILLIVIGVFIYLKQLPSFIELLYIIPVMVISPLIPDIDHPTSKVTDVFLMCGIAGLWISYIVIQNLLIFFLVLITAVFCISRYIPHRGFTHSIWFVIMFAVGIAVISNSIYIGAVGFVGAVSHLYIDK